METVLTRRSPLVTTATAPLWSRSVAARNTPLVVIGNRLFPDVGVNGVSVRALLASAAEGSCIDIKFAGRLGLSAGAKVTARGSGGDTEAALVQNIHVRALGLALLPLTAAIIDLSDVGRRLIHGPLDFIMGREQFDAARLSIDIARGAIAVVPRGAVPDGRALDLIAERGIETIPASVEGRPPVKAVLDLGNGGNVLIGASYAKKIGVRDRIVLRSLEQSADSKTFPPKWIPTGSAARAECRCFVVAAVHYNNGLQAAAHLAGGRIVSARPIGRRLSPWFMCR